MQSTIILRHRKENLKKCSLRGLEKREDLHFYTYPVQEIPELPGYLMLSLDGPPLTVEDCNRGLFLIDGTWRYAEKMVKHVESRQTFERRSIPQKWRTAYPRRQEPEHGLASVEALYAAYSILGRDTSGLLDDYCWKEAFLEDNPQ